MTVTVCPDADAACVEIPNSRRCAVCPLRLGGDNCDPRIKYRRFDDDWAPNPNDDQGAYGVKGLDDAQR